MKKIIVLISLILLTGCASSEIKTGKISCNQKNKLLENENTVIIDVRKKEEYKESHIDKAINIPYDTIIEGVEKKNIDKETPIIVHCKSGKRSEKAYETLINAGYKKVYDLGAMSNCK